MKTYFLDVIFKHYLDFGGKATRTQFWLFVLISVLISIVLGFFGKTGQTISWIFSLAIFLPLLGIAARRLRDGGFTPWLLLLCLLPLIGPLALLILWVFPSK
ncbi:MAG: DUF805 domain-containing protein [Elusimicrobiaceae bacterium]|nr:DUF805 domain-containing protein [Elusimicrobiaceae bacterium]